MSSDERIHLPYRFAGVRENGSNDAKALCRGSIKRQRIDSGEKSVDCTMDLARSSLVRTEAELGDGYRADAKLGALLLRESVSDCPDCVEREAHRVGIEHEERHELS